VGSLYFPHSQTNPFHEMFCNGEKFIQVFLGFNGPTRNPKKNLLCKFVKSASV
jgi:hypothetical protein